MFTFTDDNTVIYRTGGAPEAGDFDSEADLLRLMNERGLSRQAIQDLYHALGKTEGFAGIKRVTRFRNRPFAVNQLWKALQGLKGATAANPKGKRAEAKAPKSRRSAKPEELFRAGTKAATALGMLRRERGVSNDELAEKCGWQKHTVRGFISTLKSKHRIKVKTEKDEKRGLVYRAR